MLAIPESSNGPGEVIASIFKIFRIAAIINRKLLSFPRVFPPLVSFFLPVFVLVTIVSRVANDFLAMGAIDAFSRTNETFHYLAIRTAIAS